MPHCCSRNTLFRWLPLYNFAVMGVTLAYQAPLDELFHWHSGSGKEVRWVALCRALLTASGVMAGVTGLADLGPGSEMKPAGGSGEQPGRINPQRARQLS